MTASPRPRLDRPRPTPAGRPLQPDLHPPKVEYFDLAARVNVDPKGIPRQVDHYELITPELLYMRRGMDHPRFGYLQTYLLADVGLRANIYHHRPEVAAQEATAHVRYLDIVAIHREDPQHWEVRDLYLDLVARPKTAAVLPTVAGLAQTPPATPAHVEVEDIDELLAATAADLITLEQADWALRTAMWAYSGISQCQDDIDSWLRQLGYPINWVGQVPLTDAHGG